MSQASWAINLGLKKWGIFEEKLADTFSPTTLFVFVQNKQMTHHIKLLIFIFSINLISLENNELQNFMILPTRAVQHIVLARRPVMGNFCFGLVTFQIYKPGWLVRILRLWWFHCYNQNRNSFCKLYAQTGKVCQLGGVNHAQCRTISHSGLGIVARVKLNQSPMRDVLSRRSSHASTLSL